MIEPRVVIRYEVSGENHDAGGYGESHQSFWNSEEEAITHARRVASRGRWSLYVNKRITMDPICIPIDWRE